MPLHTLARSKKTNTLVHLLGAILALSTARAAHAEERPEQDKAEPTRAPSPPWHKGVSEERKQKAQALFLEGKALNEQLLLGDARDKYEQSLAQWEHPQLRFYLARVQKRMGFPLLAHENLGKAFAWGPNALDPTEDKEARAMLRELEQKELGAIAIRCDEAGAAVLLDGTPWFTGAGSRRRMLLPGEHVVTARKAGYFTVVKPIAVYAGKDASGVIQLSVDATLMKRRWAAWKPWALVGGGAALGALGGGLLSLASSDYEQTTQRLKADCGLSCSPDGSSPYTGARNENGFGIGALVVGGAALLSGGVMVLLNLPQAYRTNDESDVEVEVIPVASPTVAGISTRITF